MFNLACLVEGLLRIFCMNGEILKILEIRKIREIIAHFFKGCIFFRNALFCFRHYYRFRRLFLEFIE